MNETIVITGQAVIAMVCWLIVAGGAGIAVFSNRIDDMLLERIGLSAVSVASAGTAWRIVAAGWISDGATSISIALAGYVVAVFVKHIREKR